MAQIVIIGAGLTGISAAYHLEKKGFFDYKIFEKEATVGGLCRSLKQDGFTFDFTGHLLHTSDPYFRSLIFDLYGKENLNHILRKSFVYSHKTYSRYPFQINLFGLPPQVIADCVEGYVNKGCSKKAPEHFKAWVDQTFGPGFGKHFFYTYQEKIFAYPIEKLSTSWTQNFVPSTSLRQIILGSVTDTFDPSIGYNADFYYPKSGGIISWVAQLAKHIGNAIYKEHAVRAINIAQKTITFTNGHIQPYQKLITTMPLDYLLKVIQDAPSTSFSRAQKHLKCNSVVNFNLGIARPNLSNKHWIYFPEKKYPFYRIGFPHNFASTMAPAGHSSLYGEFSYRNHSPTTVHQKLKASLGHIKKLLKLSESEIATEKVITIPHAYVTYDHWRDIHVPHLLNELERYNIYSVGRYGTWKYSSMQDAVLDGKQIAQKLVVIPAKQDRKEFNYHTPLVGQKQKENVYE